MVEQTFTIVKKLSWPHGQILYENGDSRVCRGRLTFALGSFRRSRMYVTNIFCV